MNKAISEILRGLLVDITWVDKASGLVTAVRRGSEGGRTQVFPAATNVSPDYDPQVMTDMIPNSEYNSILYFEDQGMSARREGKWLRCESRLRLVCWLNGQKMRFTSEQAVKAIQEVFFTLPLNYSSGDFGQIRITAAPEETKSAAIFAGYSYSEEQTQYLLYPNDYFSLMVTVSYLASPDCFTDLDPVFLDECGNDTDFDYCEHFEASLGDRQRDCLTITLIDGNVFTENEDYGILVTTLT